MTFNFKYILIVFFFSPKSFNILSPSLPTQLYFSKDKYKPNTAKLPQTKKTKINHQMQPHKITQGYCGVHYMLGQLFLSMRPVSLH